MNHEDLRDLRVGRLTVLRQVDDGPDREWLCRCSCGRLVIVAHDRLVGKRPSRSCGCLMLEAAEVMLDTVYSRWEKMSRRVARFY